MRLRSLHQYKPLALTPLVNKRFANMLPNTSRGVVFFFAWFMGHALLGGVLQHLLGGKVLWRVLLTSIPLLLWMRSMRRVWLLKRAPGGAHLNGLLWAMGLAAAPIPLLWFMGLLKVLKPFNMLIAIWGSAFSIAAFILGSLIHAMARGIMERAVLKADVEGQRAWLVDASSWRLPVRWLRGRVLAALGAWVGGAVLMVALAPSVTSALLALGAVVFGFIATRAWYLPQARAVMSVWLTSADLLFSGAMASLCASTLIFHALVRVPVAKALGSAVVLLSIAALLRVPMWLIRRERRGWRGVWEDRLALALPALGARLVRRGYEGDPPSSVVVGVDVVFPQGSVNPISIRAHVAVVDPLMITGDPAFDTNFQVLGDEDLAHALLVAPTRALILDMHPLDLEVGVARALCVVPFPWQAQASAQALKAVVDSLNPSAVRDLAAYIDDRLLETASQDPLSTARVLAAQSLIARWRSAPLTSLPSFIRLDDSSKLLSGLVKGALWDRLRVHLRDDSPSLALIDALSLKRPPREWAARLQDPAPWPAKGEGFAQALWSLGAHALCADPTALTAVTSPQGRFAQLDPFLASEVADVARAALTPAWEPWLLDALARITYPAHGLSLCQSLAEVGGLPSISPLRVLAQHPTTPDHVRDAAQRAITAISRRVDTSGTAGGLSLMDTSGQGDLAISDQPKVG